MWPNINYKGVMDMLTYEEISKANATMKTTDIKGKDYAEVNQRIKAFRMVCPGGTIKTSMLSNDNGICVFRAEVYDGEDHLLATGTAYEKESSSFINKTSYIENCETSAVGRALGMCGFGIDTSIASYEEVTNAINNQGKDKQPEMPFKTPREQLITMLLEKGMDIKKFAAEHNLGKDTPDVRYLELIGELVEGGAE
jgi:hypothetical protein